MRGVWQITSTGRARVAGSSQESVSAGRLDLTLRDFVTAQSDELKRRLLTELRALSPAGFERFALTFLERLGFELVQTKATGDGGVDGYGHLRQGAVTIRSAFQAKHWETPIGRPEIDRFRGAIQGEFDHGVFITTSRFTQGAADASVRRGAISILLLDGSAIVNVMLERGFGVSRQPVYLMDVDPDVFTFDT